MAGDDVKLRLLAILIVEISSFEFFAHLACQARQKAAAENLREIEDKKRKQRLVSEFKEKLRKPVA
jgi:hypothetical protein